MFNALVVIFHFLYTSIEIREGTINHFHVCLECGDLAALESLQTDLAVDYLQDLHSILDVDEYLDRMSQTASQPNEKNLYGLWGDIFSIKWFSNWLKVQIVVWSLIKQTTYLHFNTKTTGYCYNLLFHN